MSIQHGTRLGPYKVVAALGAGGTGEVYKAKDTRIGREVAVKVISASLSADADKLQRFEQEARAAGAINHPNVLSIYDVGTHEGRPYIVSELLAGETLRDRLAKSKPGASKAINYAVQIACGLAAAHAHGLIHRDVKPENIFITREGRVKVLDFGLVKLLESSNGHQEQARVATVSLDAKRGLIAGTVGYMSPEQICARPVDCRSDIFSFGIVLYEMVYGRHPFRRGSEVETMSATLKEEPTGMSGEGSDASPALRNVIKGCLEKNPEERFQSAHDLAMVLELFPELTGRNAALGGPSEAAAQSRRRWALAGVGVLALFGLLALILRTVATEPLHPSFQQITFRRGTAQDARFAPDGQVVYYSAWWDGNPSQIFWTRPGSPDSSQLGLPEGSTLLSISSLGEMAILLRHQNAGGLKGTLARVPLAGGAPREILDNVRWADWSPSGTKLAIVREAEQTNRLEYPVGTVIFRTSGSILCPRVSPDGEKVAFIHRPVPGDSSGSVMLADDKDSRTLSGDWANLLGLAWSAQGDEVWFTGAKTGGNRALHAVELSGETRLVLRLPNRLTLTDIARDGRVLLSRESFQGGMMYLPHGETRERDLYWFDGSIATAISNDGSAVLFVETREASAKGYITYLRKTDGSPAIRLGEGMAMSLSPDGKWAIWIPHGSPAQIYLLPTGAGSPRQVTNDQIDHLYDFGSNSNLLGPFWFPDGQRILFSGIEPGSKIRCYFQDVDGGAPHPVTPEGVPCVSLSPDGKFAVGMDLERALWLYPLGGGEPTQIKNIVHGEVPLQWGSNGRALFVHQEGEIPNRVYKLDLADGQRSLWKVFAPSDLTGMLYIGPILLTRDGASYVYSYGRNQSDLYLIDGLR